MNRISSRLVLIEIKIVNGKNEIGILLSHSKPVCTERTGNVARHTEERQRVADRCFRPFLIQIH